MATVRINPNRSVRQKADFLVPKVVFEDGEILVLDKPAGMVVNRAQSVKGETVQDWVEKKWQMADSRWQMEEKSDFVRRSGVVHRLDKETSGLLIVAKTEKAFKNLQKQFKERRVEKRYLALVHGKVEPKEGEIRAPVGRLPWQRKKFGVIAGGRRARSEYKVISNWLPALPADRLVIGNKKEEFSFLELKPKTGRTHQLRVHLKFWGYPIVADDKYAGRKRSRQDREWCPRLFLHACFLAFTHPKTGKRVKFSSPLPSDLKKARIVASS